MRVELKEHYVPHTLSNEAHPASLVHGISVEEKRLTCLTCHRADQVVCLNVVVREARCEHVVVRIKHGAM